MANQWTEQQREAIESRGKSLLVSAAAGSGKTAVLVERIVSRIAEGYDADRFLVVTFTRAAAEEMRERIRNRLEALLAEAEGDLAVHLQKQRTLLSHAHISTIDSLCMWIVQNHFQDLDIDPDFRLGEAGELRLLQEDVIRDLMESVYEAGDPAFLNLLDNYAREKGDTGLKDLILQLYEFSQSSADPEAWIRACRAGFGSEAKTLDDLPVVAAYREMLCTELESMASVLDAKAVFLNAQGGNSKVEAAMRQDAELLHGLSASKTYEELSCIKDVKFSIKPRTPAAGFAPVDAYCLSIHSTVKERAKSIKERFRFETPGQMLAAIRGTDAPMQALLDLVCQFSESYRAAKQERNLTDFSDVAHMALKLVLSDERVRKELQDRFEEVVIDEYQDSNELQERLLQAISGESRGRYNRFMVGDVKQSIYRFRQARPEIFIEKYDRYPDCCESGSVDEGKIDLSANFRSRREVVDSVNHIFYQIMGRELGGIAYDDDSALHARAKFPEAEDDAYATEALIITSDSEMSDRKDIEAALVARRIRALMDSGFQIFDGKRDCMRPLRYSDITILLRTMRGWAESMTKALSQRGIPSYSALSNGFFSAVEIKVVLDLLKIIDNPRQDIPLMAVLTSPIGGVTERTVAKLKAESVATGGDRYNTDLIDILRISNDPDVTHFLNELSLYRRLSLHMTVMELIEYVLERTGYLYYVTALPGGEKRRANLELLKEKARTFATTSYQGLFQFNRYIEQLKKYDVDFGEASELSEQDDLVRITSIHKSKGLQYPVVILAGTGKEFNHADERQMVLAHENLGIAADFVDADRCFKQKTLLKKVLADKIAEEMKAEELRVLYVAMTRASEKLIITGCRKLTKSEDAADAAGAYGGFQSDPLLPGWIVGKAKCLLDFIRMGLIRDPGNIQLREYSDEGLMEEEAEDLKTIMERLSALKVKAEGKTAADEEREKARLNDLLRFRYAFENATKHKATASVSELKEKRMDESMTSIFTPSEGTPAGALRGTCYHALMQYYPLEAGTDRDRIEAYLKAALERGLVDPDAAELLTAEDICSFYETKVGSRAAAAWLKGKLYRERPFLMSVPAELVWHEPCEDEVLIQGIIDLYFEEDDRLILVDYKTDRVSSPELLIDRYRSQLIYYADALTKGTGLPVSEIYIYSVSLRRIIRVDQP